MKRIPFLIFFFFAAGILSAQSLNISGFAQTWFSLAQQHRKENSALGFNLKRVKINTFGNLTSNIEWRIQFIWSKQNPKLHDVYLYFDLADEFKIKAGQFPVPGSPSGALVSASRLDFVERAMFIQKWGKYSGLSSYRTLGLQIDGNLMWGNLYYALMAANPDAEEMFQPGVGSDTYRGDNTLLFSGRLEFKPFSGLRVGGFYLYGNDTSDSEVNESYGAHLFYIHSLFFLKGEYIEGTSEWSPYGAPNEYEGYMVKAGYKYNRIQPVFRYDYYRERGGFGLLYVADYKNTTVGINYFYDENIKIQANYVFRDELVVNGFGKIDNNIFYVNLQYRF